MSIFFGIGKSSQRRLSAQQRQQTSARRKTEREVCALIARGNISLQQGDYITQADMDALQNELESFFSSKQSEW